MKNSHIGFFIAMWLFGLLLCAFIFSGCTGGIERYYADRVSKKVMSDTPYCLNVFDCSERAGLAMCYLMQDGYTVRLVNQCKDGKAVHDCVVWTKNGKLGRILCEPDLEDC